jgi:chromosome segregation ATPase
MNDNYSALLKRLGELMSEIQEFKKEILEHEQKVNSDLIQNTDLMEKQKDLLNKVKLEISSRNNEYRMNLEEVTLYIKKELLSDIDKHINKKIEEIDHMMKPLVNRVIKFQDSVNDFENTISDSTTKLEDLVEESNRIFQNHIRELDKYTLELSDKKDSDNFIYTDEETLEDLIRRLLDEKLYPIIERIGQP